MLADAGGTHDSLQRYLATVMQTSEIKFYFATRADADLTSFEQTQALFE
jgi:hypothetical protein